MKTPSSNVTRLAGRRSASLGAWNTLRFAVGGPIIDGTLKHDLAGRKNRLVLGGIMRRLADPRSADLPVRFNF